MILIYTPVIKPRIQFIFSHFFCSRMGKEISFTSDLSTFIAHQGQKMSYGEAPLGNEFFISAHGLLTQQGINTIDVHMFDWEGLPAFFSTHKKGNLPFDFFSAAFYLLSRYEEYQPFVADSLGRFKPKQSLAFSHQFLHLPLVDLWFERFLTAWNSFFKTSVSISHTFQKSILVEIPYLYAYKHKSILRSIVEGFQDLFRLKFGYVFDRLAVLLRFREDPLTGIHAWIEQFQERTIPIQFFVLFSSLGVHDRSLGVFNKTHQQQIKSISDYAPTAPLASYDSLWNSKLLRTDTNRFANLTHRPVKAIRQHKVALRFPETYRNFSQLGIKNDYSMHYPQIPGFRASTAFPFRFYDLEEEQQTPLVLHPVCLTESHLRKQGFSRKIRQLFLEYQERLETLQAPFVIALTNESFNSRSKNQPFMETLKRLLFNE